jgi:hypothetical protein
MLARFLPDAYSCAVIVLCTASVACCWWWFASGLPSPPGLASSLSFTSWTCSWLLLVLLLLLRWAAGSSPPELDLELQLDAMVLLEIFVWGCARTVAVLGVVQYWTCECCSPGTTHLVDCLALLADVVLPAPASPPVTKLLVSCVFACFTQVVLILTWPSCETAVANLGLYPSDF